MKQFALADALNISQQAVSHLERFGHVAERHWPIIEQTLRMKKEDIQAITEEEVNGRKSGDQYNSNNMIVSYNLNLTINGADPESLAQVRALFEQLAALQKNPGK